MPTNHSSGHLRADGITKSFGDRRVLTDLGLVVDGRGCTALIGENGAGKSTLLRILAGVDEPDAGTVSRPRRTGFLRQEVRHRPEQTLLELIEDSLAELRGIERELDAAASALGAVSVDAADRYARALAAAERAEVWTIDSRRDAVLAGLGVSGISLERRVAEVSGGQRARFALAALLLGRPDALLLDEPTNHLDDDATRFLAEQLTSWAGPVLFASHDRAFLDEVATTIVDLDPARSGSTRYGGGYSDYLAEKAAERARWEARFAAEQEELAELGHSVAVTSRAVAPDRRRTDNDKMGYDFKTGRIDKQISRRVRNARERLDELTATQLPRPPAPLTFAGIPSGSTAVKDEGALVGLAAASIEGRLRQVTVQIRSDASLLITGANGAGKSTLLGALAGRERLDSGALRRRRGLRIGILEQDVRFADPRASCRCLYERALGESRADAVPLASLGLLAPRDLDRPVGALSLGQQRRMALALIVAKPPHVFLLDEPTNHLSLALATELEEALGTYPGAVVIASHDRWLRRRWGGAHLEMTHGRLRGATT